MMTTLEFAPLRRILMQIAAGCGRGVNYSAQEWLRTMPKRKQEVSRLSVPVTSEQKSVLEEIANESKVSIARVLQEAVKEFVERHPEGRFRLFAGAGQDST